MIVDNRYTVSYTVASSEIDGKYRCTPLTFAALSQDLAANHYSSTGLFIPHLQKIGLTWVITKQHFEIYEYPLWLDRLILQTWAQPLKGVFCFRDFAYYYAKGGKHPSAQAAFHALTLAEQTGGMVDKLNQQEALCLRGSSCWLVLDTRTGQPVTPDSTTLGSLTFCSDHLDGRVFAKIVLPDIWDEEKVFMPSLLDIDMNEHINNLNYIRWILSCMNADFCSGKLLHILDTNFLVSAKYGEELCCRCAYTDSNVCIHSIVRTKDGSEVFRARTEWVDEERLARRFLVD